MGEEKKGQRGREREGGREEEGRVRGRGGPLPGGRDLQFTLFQAHAIVIAYIYITFLTVPFTQINYKYNAGRCYCFDYGCEGRTH